MNSLLYLLEVLRTMQNRGFGEEVNVLFKHYGVINLIDYMRNGGFFILAFQELVESETGKTLSTIPGESVYETFLVLLSQDYLLNSTKNSFS